MGWVDIFLPRFVGFLGQDDRRRHHLFYENFSSGVLATLLATPCSAPFLGTAVGFALAGSSVDVVLIFLVLGLGFSLPWLFVALFPNSGRMIVPRPGVWMEVFRKLLSLPMLATVIWLLSLLTSALSEEGVKVFAIGLAVLFLSLFIRSLGLSLGRSSSRLVFWGFLFLLLVFVQWDFQSYGQKSQQPPPQSQAGIDWRPFAPERIPDYLRDGKTVFIDITADWCITCKVNKLFVLDKDSLVSHFVKSGIEAQQGDLTYPDEDIAAWMASYGRYGVPFDAVFGPKYPQGIILPEILSEEMVIEALRKAQGAVE